MLKNTFVLALIACVLFSGCSRSNDESQACGYGGTSNKKVACACDGELTSNVKTGATTYVCEGECMDCKCYRQDWSAVIPGEEPTLEAVDCHEFSELDWAFPLE